MAYWNHELYRMRAADGGGLRRLTFWGSGRDGAPGDDLLPDYSPDGTRIAFVSDRGGGYGIWTMRADGTDVRRLVRHAGLSHVFPRYSPDGSSLVYSTFSPGATGNTSRLWTIRADGTGRTALGPGGEPDW